VADDSAVLSIQQAEGDAGISVGTRFNASVVALMAIALGASILFTVGFSHSDLLHAAAHDVRHAAGFPCH
jgi:cobalt transporter subunit CbtB